MRARRRGNVAQWGTIGEVWSTILVILKEEAAMNEYLFSNERKKVNDTLCLV